MPERRDRAEACAGRPAERTTTTDPDSAPSPWPFMGAMLAGAAARWLVHRHAGAHAPGRGSAPEAVPASAPRTSGGAEHRSWADLTASPPQAAESTETPRPRSQARDALAPSQRLGLEERRARKAEQDGDYAGAERAYTRAAELRLAQSRASASPALAADDLLRSAEEMHSAAVNAESAGRPDAADVHERSALGTLRAAEEANDRTDDLRAAARRGRIAVLQAKCAQYAADHALEASAQDTSKLADAEALYGTMFDLAMRAEATGLAASALLGLGIVAARGDQAETATQLWERAEEAADVAGWPWVQAEALARLALLEHQNGEDGLAQDYCRRVFETSQHANSPGAETLCAGPQGFCAELLAWLAQSEDAERAARWLEQAVEFYEQAGLAEKADAARASLARLDDGATQEGDR